MHLFSRSEHWLKATALCALLLGAFLRLVRAYTQALNPDEALHLLPCYADSLAETLRLLSNDAHPPLHSAVTCMLRPLLYSEFGSRLFGVLAGLALAVVLYFWLRERLSLAAACAALMATALSPALIDLSAEVRSYSLAMLLIALVLLWLDRGIARSSDGRLVLAGVTVSLAILTDYAVLLVCPALALYGAARLWESRAPVRAWWIWACGQALALGVLFCLYWFHIRYLKASPADFGTSWLNDGFRQAGQMIAVFWGLASLKQFSYFAGTFPAGALFAAIYVLTLTKASLPWRVLMLTPFATGVILASLQLFPFGGTRHSSVVAVFIAAGLGLAAHLWLASRSRLRRLSIPLLLILGFVLIERYQPHFSWPLQLRRDLHGIPAYLSELSSTGIPILVTGEAWVVVDAYRSMQHIPPFPLEHRKEWAIPLNRVESEFALFRRRHSIQPHEPVYFVEGGFKPFVFPNPKPSKLLRQFGTIRLWAIHEYGHSAEEAATQ